MIRAWLQNRARNYGHDIGTWPKRMDAAWKLLRTVVPADAPPRHVADMGCGRQDLRSRLPSDWTYLPYDWISRSPDTRVIDLTRQVPTERQDITFILGVFEYMPQPSQLLRYALTHSQLTVFSCFHGWSPLRAWREGWRGRLTQAEVERLIAETQATVRAQCSWGADGNLWVCESAIGATA